VANATGTLLHRTTSREDARYCNRDAVCVNSVRRDGACIERLNAYNARPCLSDSCSSS
jgi:hypothetical protein